MSAEAEYLCANCGEPHPEHDPPCRHCGSEQFAELLEERFVSETPPRQETLSTEMPPVSKSIGDVLFNKSALRQLIDLQLLIMTGFTWVGFLISEVIYHRWRISRGEPEKSQFSYSGAKGEGPITKGAKVLFIGQFAVLLLIIAAFAF